MSKLESTISELERQLALKKAYQAVKFTLPKGTPEDVAAEVQTKLREWSEALALSGEQQVSSSFNYGEAESKLLASFTAEQLEALKLIADATLAKTKGNANPVPAAPAAQGPTPGGASVHQPKSSGSPRKAKILVTENVRGEGKRVANVDDEVYVPNPEKVDDHGMVSATHMRRGIMLKIPVDDLDFLD